MAETNVVGRQRARWYAPTLSLAAVALPLGALLIAWLLRQGHGYTPVGDHALIEMRVRDIGHHPVLVGIYSRYGWYHPGPALFYLLWLPYQLTRHASLSLPATAILVNLLSVAGIVAIVYRRAGRAAAWWAAAVLLLDLR
ncbi:MAG TPA: hypothetical protein VLL25_00385, partial [Acidimicrobiales bacterium]|nr:hypothetical protein [Acidimicrobiales bacterium]